jgi:hypothetical protein
MRKVVMLSSLFAVIAGLTLWTCSKTSNSVGSGGGSVPWTYTRSNDTVFLNDPGTTFSWCDSANPNVRDTEIQAPTKDTMWYTLSSNGDTMLVMQNTGAQVCTRVGTGSGIQGAWNTMFDSLINATIQISATTITLTSVCNAQWFMTLAVPYLTEPFYNITATEVSCNQIILTGNISKEVVTISFSQPVLDFDYIGEFNTTFTSNIAGHSAFTIYADPVTCPDEEQAWFETFLSANSLIPTKRTEASSSAVSTALQKIRLVRKMKIF